MKRVAILIFFVFLINLVFGAIIINEIDAETPGADNAEFVELYDGGSGNTSLDGYVLVFFNGSNDESYYSADLDGYSTDVDGYFLLGNLAVVPSPSIIFSNGLLQNGADAVAIYTDDASSFPNGTSVTTTNLIDAIVYDSNDADDAGLLVLLNALEPQVNESGGGFEDTESMQRNPNGSGGARNTSTYVNATPTPGESILIEPISGQLIINELNSTSIALATYVELYNLTSNELGLSQIDVEYYGDGAASPNGTVNLTGSIEANGYSVIARSISTFNTVYGFDADFALSALQLNGEADGVILRTNANGVIDQFNDVPNATNSIVDNTLFERKNYPNDGSSITNHWANMGINQDGTPAATNDTPLPVTLSTFTTQYISGNAILNWTTQSEVENQGWNIYRSNSNDIEQSVVINAEGMIEGAGTTSEPTDYIYEDENEIQFNTVYWYWIESRSYAGDTELFGPATLTTPYGDPNYYNNSVPIEYGLFQNHPNPFNPSTEITFMLAESAEVDLTIYDIKGRKIKTLLSNETVIADQVQNILWNGEDAGGKQVSSGLYFYKLSTPSYTKTNKMIMLK